MPPLDAPAKAERARLAANYLKIGNRVCQLSSDFAGGSKAALATQYEMFDDDFMKKYDERKEWWATEFAKPNNVNPAADTTLPQPQEGEHQAIPVQTDPLPSQPGGEHQITPQQTNHGKEKLLQAKKHKGDEKKLQKLVEEELRRRKKRKQ